MLYKGYDTYGYDEPESFKTTAEQKDFKFGDVKNVELPVRDGESFYTENGQPTNDLVQVEF